MRGTFFSVLIAEVLILIAFISPYPNSEDLGESESSSGRRKYDKLSPSTHKITNSISFFGLVKLTFSFFGKKTNFSPSPRSRCRVGLRREGWRR
jgi:hypothetical protein